MENTQYYLKNKAKVLSLASIVLNSFALALVFVMFFYQEKVFELYGVRDLKVDFRILLSVIYPAIVSIAFYAVHHLWIVNSQKSFKAIAIVFLFFYIGYGTIISPVLVMYNTMVIGKMGVQAVASLSAFSNATGIVTSLFKSVASAFFFISSAFMIAQDAVLGNKQ